MTATGMTGVHKHGKGGKVWLTPPEIVRACGPFDLDPCFPWPRPWDTATVHYGPNTGNDRGGLGMPWFGLVWCNPPYDDQAWVWLRRCADHGDAIALIFARTEVEQFHRQVWEKATALLFLEGRLYFHTPDGERANNNAGAPSVLVAYGQTAKSRLMQSGLTGHYQELDNDR